MGIEFLAEICAGCGMMTAACRSDHVAPSWVRRMAIICFALLLAIAGGLLLQDQPQLLSWIGIAIAAICLIALLINNHQDPPGSIQRACGWLAAFCAWLCAIDMRGAWNGHANPVPAISSALAAAILGGTTTAMLLGHAYLTHTTMPIDPLRRLTGLLAAAVGLRMVWCAGVLAMHWAELANPHGDPAWLWMMLSVRVGVGLLGLGVLTYMIWDCVKRRSTQSATGILYIAMIFAYFGELAALELNRSFGLAV